MRTMSGASKIALWCCAVLIATSSAGCARSSEVGVAPRQKIDVSVAEADSESDMVAQSTGDSRRTLVDVPPGRPATLAEVEAALGADVLLPNSPLLGAGTIEIVDDAPGPFGRITYKNGVVLKILTHHPQLDYAEEVALANTKADEFVDGRKEVARLQNVRSKLGLVAEAGIQTAPISGQVNHQSVVAWREGEDPVVEYVLRCPDKPTGYLLAITQTMK